MKLFAIKLTRNPSQSDGRLYHQPALLTNWVNMPAVLVTGLTVMQNCGTAVTSTRSSAEGWPG